MKDSDTAQVSVFRQSAWQPIILVAAILVLSAGLLLSRQFTLGLLSLFCTIGAASWGLLALKNRRIECDDAGLAHFDWLGRETVRSTWAGITKVSTSSSMGLSEESFIKVSTPVQHQGDQHG